MPNTYFTFKKFAVQQENTAMKVCTDSCLFGAFIAHKISQAIIQPINILDIGTGTGLLSLMLAQKTNAVITAIDIDVSSCNEAIKNFKESLWNECLQAFQADVKEWKTDQKYDWIICNPPFYENDLLPENNAKKISKHHSYLTIEELLICVKELLEDEGYFALLLPSHRADWLINNVEKHKMYISEHVQIRQTVHHNYFRSIFIIQKTQKYIVNEELSIKDNSNAYTKEFTSLLKDYYLYL